MEAGFSDVQAPVNGWAHGRVRSAESEIRIRPIFNRVRFALYPATSESEKIGFPGNQSKDRQSHQAPEFRRATQAKPRAAAKLAAPIRDQNVLLSLA
jgi:hypothetical protein